MTALYVALMVFAIGSGFAWHAAGASAWALVSFLMAGALGVSAWKKRERKPAGTLRLAPPPNMPEGFLPESFEKAVADYNAIQGSLPRVRDGEIVAVFQNMQHTARGMLGYLEKHPNKLPRARRFIDYYQDQARSFLVRYQELEAAGLQSAGFREATERFRAILYTLDNAYREQFARLFDDDLLEMDADFTVMRQMMDADGIQGGPAAPAGSGGYDASLFPERSVPPHGSVSASPTSVPAAYEAERRLARRQKLIAGALGIFLGTFGAHKFYFGKTKWGFLYALMSWTGLPGFLGFVEGIRYIFMPLDDFYEQYYKGDAT